jgi:3-oxoacyl-[acyl-carrier-protein] synthase III
MVETSDMDYARVGIKERNFKSEGPATSDMGAEAVNKLLAKTGNQTQEVNRRIGTINPT